MYSIVTKHCQAVELHQFLDLTKNILLYFYSLIALVGNMANVRPLLPQKKFMLTHTQTINNILITILNNANN